MEKKRRSILKGITYRTGATVASTGLAYFMTGNVGTALLFGTLDFFVKLTLYYLNDRVWNQFTWGLTYSVKKSIITKRRNKNAKF